MKKNKFTYRVLVFLFLLFGKASSYGVEYILLLTHESDHDFNLETKKKYDYLVSYIKNEILTSDTRFSFMENDVLKWENYRVPFRSENFSAEESLLRDKNPNTIGRYPKYAITFRDESEGILVDVFQVNGSGKPDFRLKKGFLPLKIDRQTRRDDSKFIALISDITNEIRYYIKNNHPRKKICISRVENKTNISDLPIAESLRKAIVSSPLLTDISFFVRDQPYNEIPLGGLCVLNCRFLEQKVSGDKTLIKTELVLIEGESFLTLIGSASETNPGKKDVYLDKNKIIIELLKKLNISLSASIR